MAYSSRLKVATHWTYHATTAPCAVPEKLNYVAWPAAYFVRRFNFALDSSSQVLPSLMSSLVCAGSLLGERHLENEAGSGSTYVKLPR